MTEAQQAESDAQSLERSNCSGQNAFQAAWEEADINWLDDTRSAFIDDLAAVWPKRSRHAMKSE